ncbi:RHS repeat-associated core domain-containing protein [Pseudomonas sp. SAS7]|uniref:RHS repeat-associated core domain-containing protein n=1 Tax=Pseudomonas sp. SAS7 TaxID=3156487 RepID=UPI003F96AB38
MMRQQPDSAQIRHFSAYTPYGYAINAPEQVSLLAFNSQHRDSLTGTYLLGNGHRCYNPALQRFQAADVLSPFDAGGINAYAYCGGDPINRTDPSGRSWMGFFNRIANLFRRTRGRDRVPVAPTAPTAHELHRARLEGRIPPSIEQAESEDLLLPNYQYVEDNLPSKVQQSLAQIREERRIINADLRYMKIRRANAPEDTKRKLERLDQKSLRLRSRSANDLTQPVNFPPNYSTAIIETAPPAQITRHIRRS